MKLLSSITLAAALIASCGLLKQNDDSAPARGNDVPPQDSFELTGKEATTLNANGLRTNVNNFTFLSNVKFASQSASEFASYISRGKAKNFTACVKKKLDSVPLEVTGDTVSYSFNFDFIALCDDAAQPDDLIDSIKNTMRGNVVIGCAGGKLGTLAGQESGALKDAAALCDNSQSLKYSYNFYVDARKATKTKVNTEFEVTSVESKLASASLSATDGGPCVLTVTDKKSRVMSACKAISQSKTYSGAPKYESNSPVVPSADDVHAKEPRPVVVQAAATVTNASIDTDAPYYGQGTTAAFSINGWNGTVNYINGWAAPTWSATKNTEKAGGTFGSNTVL